MCGISGFTFSDEGLIKQMNSSILHRGPDDSGVFVGENISLGHARLSVIDLSERGHQPMVSEDGRYVLVYNGEVYNFKEIKANLEKKGFNFKSDSDSEVVLNSYVAYGRECVNYFNGMFAFAIWDKEKKELFLARDRVGVKPLYYHLSGANIVFSSEIKAILKHKVKRVINFEALNIYFRMLYVPAPLTMFSGIFKLEPGSFLIWKNGETEIKKYWQTNTGVELSNKSETESMIRDLMQDSVSKQLVADRPVGVFLSGGVDSTIIAGLAAELTHNEIKTFSVNFDVKHKKFNSDAALAKLTSNYFGTDHHEYLISGTDAANNIESVIYHMDEPVANTTQVATYLLSKYTKKHVAVVLGGDGGDELFGGYERYRLGQMIERYNSLPNIVKKSFGNFGIKLLSHYKPSLNKFLLSSPPEIYLSFMSQDELDISRVLKSNINNLGVTSQFYTKKYYSESGLDVANSMMWTDLQSWLVDESLLRSDKMSMAFGLEQRVPILDHRLVELSLRIPSAWKIHGKVGKSIFRDAMAQYIPAHIRNQPKRGWFSPTSEWFRGPLFPLVKEVLSPSYNSYPQDIFDFTELNKMLEDHIERREYHMNLLWAVVTFQIWYKNFFRE